ncbi:UbiA family prenyltransferase [Pseudobutyrivibrio ruminis]|uniref:1,4-dihydroxy-2-naphthoate octaprenyltransferase n=1 Tax=Pseudobutyrivibrio ruminis DSM 9787 TaxID=1123011 RepID=A0A285SG66_9FIRM|nr:UbiA family prenyltransferase [Pseudobutyrivibrio ruminis]SOC06370.1 1,4-dihydroxy-2-naphthoate octaprenyltransferase [Pseudobutyrivibrio ruminis DSM 9787]
MIKKFLKFVEIQTKITSTFAFANTLMYMLFLKQPINIPLMIIFCIAAFIFDLATTAINNYIDSKDYPEMLPFRRDVSLFLIICMLAVSTVMGLYLAFKTGIVVLLLGALCFGLGIFYTFGPMPISRIPLGEVFSGIAYGMFIPFLMVYINNPDEYIILDYKNGVLSVHFMLWPLISFLFFSLVNTFTTSNIMVANNTCDLEKDVAVNRHTLIFYIGQKNGVRVFATLYYLCYAAVIAMVALKILPIIALIFLLSFPLVESNIRVFRKEQIKSKTFITAIKNFIIVNTSYFIALTLSFLMYR